MMLRLFSTEKGYSHPNVLHISMNYALGDAELVPKPSLFDANSSPGSVIAIGLVEDLRKGEGDEREGCGKHVGGEGGLVGVERCWVGGTRSVGMQTESG
jgi:hypothetical protein